MKRRILTGIVATLLLIAGSGVAQAEEGTRVEMGLKLWLNQWTLDAPNAASTTSDATMLLGPVINVKFENQFFAEASYLFSTSDYRFSDPTFKSDLQDLELTAGYDIIPGFGIVAGYKNSSRQNKVLGGKSTLDGPLLGLLGIAQVDESFSVYGKIDYLFTRFKASDASGSFREDSPGWLFDFGLKYALTKRFSGVIGYRYETDKGVDTGARDTFAGFTISGLITY